MICITTLVGNIKDICTRKKIFSRQKKKMTGDKNKKKQGVRFHDCKVNGLLI